jgi:hypothetical protein
MTPLWCEACRRWIPHPPERDLLGPLKIAVSGICSSCCAIGWDYDQDLKLVQQTEE